MALVSCPECSNQVSDAAVSCPSCGHPMQPAQQEIATPQTKPKEDKKELFKAGGSNFVLDEIAAVSSVKTRNWVYLAIVLPIIIAIIAAWMKMEWPIAVGVTIAGMMIISIFHVDEGKIASTGNITDISENMDVVSQRYHDSISDGDLIIYKGRNTFVDMNFSINPERVAEFSQASSNSHIWLYAIGVIAIALGYELNTPLFYAAGAAIAVLGFMIRKASLEITGVGGAKVQLYTKANDVKRVLEDLTQSIESANKA